MELFDFIKPVRPNGKAKGSILFSKYLSEILDWIQLRNRKQSSIKSI